VPVVPALPLVPSIPAVPVLPVLPIVPVQTSEMFLNEVKPQTHNPWTVGFWTISKLKMYLDLENFMNLLIW
jgi:hypothetical protein